VNVDDRLGLIGVYGADRWTLVRRGRRTGGYAGSILTDALCYPARIGLQAVHGPAVLLDTGCVILSAVDAERTETYSRTGSAQRLEAGEACRAVMARGMDERTYLLIANFGPGSQDVAVDLAASSWRDLSEGEVVEAEDRLGMPVGSGRARLLVKEE
jgi:hypothetical protein